VIEKRDPQSKTLNAKDAKDAKEDQDPERYRF